MSLPLTKTLAELRSEVLLRCGYSIEGNQSAAVAPLVSSLVAGSERELFMECTWLQAQRRTLITLTADSNVVDWPDDAEPGEIDSVVVIRADTGELSEVQPGTLLNERNSGANGESGRPVVYEYMDKTIYLQPAPSSDYAQLEITYKLAPRLVQEADRCLVDSELLIQRATMKFKEYLGLPLGAIEMANHERYLARLRASNSQKNGYTMAGNKSWRTDVQKRNRVTKNDRYGSGSAYTEGWNPWY